MFRRILFILFVTVAAAGTVFGYFYLRSVKKPRVDVNTLIPADCSWVIECDDLSAFSKKLRETSLIWEELQQEACFRQLDGLVQRIDSLTSSDSGTRKLFAGTRIYMARYATTKSSAFLFAFNLAGANQDEELSTFLKSHAASCQTLTLSGNAGQAEKIVFKDHSDVLFIYHSAGTVLISADQQLLEKALDKNVKALAADAHFQKLEEDGGNNMDFRLYFRNSFYSSILAPETFDTFPLNSNNEWTALDFTSTPNEFRLNGFIDADSSLFMQALRRQSPVEMQFMQAAPKNTTAFTFLGISDYPTFSSGMLEKGEVLLREKTKVVSDLTEAGLVNEWSACFTGELVLLEAAMESSNNVFGLASISDKTSAAKLLDQIADTTRLFAGASGTDSVFVFSSQNIFSLLSCDVLSSDLRCAWVTDNYILFARNDSLVKEYMKELGSYGTLAKSERFAATQETNLNAACNFYYYSDLSRHYKQSIGLLHPAFTGLLQNPEERLKKFGFAGIQLSAHKGKMLTQSCLHYNPVTKQQSLTLWEAQLDTLSSCVPQVLINHRTGTKELFVSDDKGTIYLISNTGKIQWKKNPGGKLMSKVYQVDFFKNGKLQMLFNTEDYIHLIDRNGNYVSGYPLKLEQSATNAIAVYDYENTKDYRILIACSNKKIYNYNINGKLVEGFNFPETKEIVQLPVDFRRISAKDYLIACDKAGNLYGTGRKGETRLVFKNTLSPNCKAYYLDEGKDISRSKFYYFDFNEASLKQLSLDDRPSSKSIDSEIRAGEVQFDFVNEDRLIDYIISDESGFEALDDEGNKLINFISKTDLKAGVKPIQINNQQYFIVLDKSDRMLVVDVAGKMLPDKNNFFSVLPLLSDINGNGTAFLIGIHKDKVNCYEFRE